MAKFRVPGHDTNVVESPAVLFRDLPRDEGIKYLWAHQEKMLDEYYSKHLGTADVAFELPTGSGKTLVGLLIAEYRRRKDGEAVAFLCPTRQLCKQVYEQATGYGIPTVNLSGSHREWSPKDRYRFQQGQAVAVATYSTVFNSRPAIDDVSVFICDDAHAAADYVAGLWTLKIERSTNGTLYDRVVGLLRPILPTNVAMAIENAFDDDVADLVSPIRLREFTDDLKNLLSEAVAEDSDLRWPWGQLASHIPACHLYCSSQSVEIRPVVPPTDTHPIFTTAKQRVYMSATLGKDGDLERAFGRRSISRLPIPEGWDTRGTGRRLVMQPGLAIDDPAGATVAILKRAGRGLWLTSSSRRQERVAEMLRDAGFTVVGLGNRDLMVEEFSSTPAPAAIVVACRYDGIDLPGPLCRVVVVEGLPRSLGLQERFLYEKLQAQAELRDRIRTRVVQAFGRCTRDETDFSVVIVLAGALNNWLAIPANTRGMHPQSQAEIQFGAENSLDLAEDEFEELCASFLEDRSVRQDVDRGVRILRERVSRFPDPEAEHLAKAARCEIDYSHRMWKEDFPGALESAGKVIDALEGGVALRPYRGFWHHASAVAAFFAWKGGGQSRYRSKCLEEIRNAQACSYSVSWLAQVEAMLEGTLELDHGAVDDTRIRNDAAISFLNDVKLVGTKFETRLDETRGLLGSTKSTDFERGLKTLGQMVGARATRPKGKGAPDGLWYFDSFAVVLEAKSNAMPDGAVSIDTVRQASSHEARVRADGLVPDKMPVVGLLVTPQEKVDVDAAKISQDLHVFAPSELLRLFEEATRALSEVRSAATTLTDDSLVSLIEKTYVARRLTGPDLRDRFCASRIADLPLG